MKNPVRSSHCFLVNLMVLSLAFPGHLAWAQVQRPHAVSIDSSKSALKQAKEMSKEDHGKLRDELRKTSLEFLGKAQKNGTNLKVFANRDRTQPLDLSQPLTDVKKGTETFKTFDLQNQAGDQTFGFGLWTRVTQMNKDGFAMAVRVCDDQFDCDQGDNKGPITSTVIKFSVHQSPDDNVREYERRMRDIGRKVIAFIDAKAPAKSPTAPTTILGKLLKFFSISSVFAQSSNSEKALPKPDDNRTDKIKEQFAQSTDHLVRDILVTSLIFLIFEGCLVAMPLIGVRKTATTRFKAIWGVGGTLVSVGVAAVLLYAMRKSSTR